MACEHTKGFCLTCERARQRAEVAAPHVPPSIRQWALDHTIDEAVDGFDFGERNTDVVRELAIASSSSENGFRAPLANVWSELDEDIQNAVVDAYLKHKDTRHDQVV